MANFREEKKLWKKGYKWVAGLDEVGRGSLVGPVVAAAVCLKKNLKSNIHNLISNLKDSKKLSPKRREEFYKILTRHPQIKWGIGVISEKVIDKINILEATKLAMMKAVKDLNSKLKSPTFALRASVGRQNSKLKPKSQNFNNKIQYLIIDGNFTLPAEVLAKAGINYSHAIPQKPIVKGDEKVFSCAAASIIAKVWRDRLMQKLHKKYPKYGFDRHKGYPTRAHRAMLKKHGPCEIHRMSFKPVAKSQKHAPYHPSRARIGAGSKVPPSPLRRRSGYGA